MSLSEFRYNKKRKHYAYLFKAVGHFRRNVLFTTKPIRLWRGKRKKNIKLFQHPNRFISKDIYIIPIVYMDDVDCFYSHILKWEFHINDKRIVKRIKRRKGK